MGYVGQHELMQTAHTVLIGYLEVLAALAQVQACQFFSDCIEQVPMQEACCLLITAICYFSLKPADTCLGASAACSAWQACCQQAFTYRPSSPAAMTWAGLTFA